jgi:hypothetical protein
MLSPENVHTVVSGYHILGRLEEGGDAINLCGYLEMTDTGKRVLCLVLLECRALGLFTDVMFA